MAVSQDWKHILHDYLSLHREEKQRIANDLLVKNSRTIDHWMAGRQTPRDFQRIRKLSRILPDQPDFEIAIRRAFPDAFEQSSTLFNENDIPSIPSVFYARVIEAFVMMAEPRWTIQHMVLRSMIHQIDSDRFGTFAVIAQCTPDEMGIVRSLWLENAGVGTGQWLNVQLSLSLSIGKGTLSASAIINRIPVFFLPTKTDVTPAPFATFAETIQSAASFPIQRQGSMAGAIFVASKQHHFFSETIRDIICQYVNVISLAFHEKDFYSLDMIQLEDIPLPELKYTHP